MRNSNPSSQKTIIPLDNIQLAEHCGCSPYQYVGGISEKLLENHLEFVILRAWAKQVLL
jgi:hypothetical protein